MRKYIIEVSEEGIKKTFVDGKKEYTETWVRDEHGNSRTTEACITAQLDQYGDFEEGDLIELLEQDDMEGLWDYFEENSEPSKGELIKVLATCKKCNTVLFSKYENGIWGFGTIRGSKETSFYAICPFCNSDEQHPIDKEDIKEIIS